MSELSLVFLRNDMEEVKLGRCELQLKVRKNAFYQAVRSFLGEEMAVPEKGIIELPRKCQKLPGSSDTYL